MQKLGHVRESYRAETVCLAGWSGKEGLHENVYLSRVLTGGKEPVIGKAAGEASWKERPSVQRHCGERTGVFREQEAGGQ